MSDEAPPLRRRGVVPAVLAVALVGVLAGGVLALVLRHFDGPATSSDAVVDRVPTTVPVALADAFVAVGAPGPVADCAAATLADQPVAVQAVVVEAPLAPGAAREAVSACALEHLAGDLEAAAGLAGTDARCVAAAVLDRLGLETVLASIGALAVTADVEAAAAEAVAGCAP